MTPIDRLLASVDWKPVEKGSIKDVGDGDIPYCTHEGVFRFMGLELRCYQLSNGQRVVNAEDVAALGRRD